MMMRESIFKYEDVEQRGAIDSSHLLTDPSCKALIELVDNMNKRDIIKFPPIDDLKKNEMLKECYWSVGKIIGSVRPDDSMKYKERMFEVLYPNIMASLKDNMEGIEERKIYRYLGFNSKKEQCKVLRDIKERPNRFMGCSWTYSLESDYLEGWDFESTDVMLVSEDANLDTIDLLNTTIAHWLDPHEEEVSINRYDPPEITEVGLKGKKSKRINWIKVNDLDLDEMCSNQRIYHRMKDMGYTLD